MQGVNKVPFPNLTFERIKINNLYFRHVMTKRGSFLVHLKITIFSLKSEFEWGGGVPFLKNLKRKLLSSHTSFSMYR